MQTRQYWRSALLLWLGAGCGSPELELQGPMQMRAQQTTVAIQYVRGAQDRDAPLKLQIQNSSSLPLTLGADCSAALRFWNFCLIMVSNSRAWRNWPTKI